MEEQNQEMDEHEGKESPVLLSFLMQLAKTAMQTPSSFHYPAQCALILYGCLQIINLEGPLDHLI